MTIDDAITIFHGLECNPLFSEKHFKAFDMAIESLEAWDKVKQEIEDMLETLSDGGDDWFTAEKLNDVLEIIDKHLQEVTP